MPKVHIQRSPVEIYLRRGQGSETRTVCGRVVPLARTSAYCERPVTCGDCIISPARSAASRANGRKGGRKKLTSDPRD